ncbi:hypothetical protein DID78_01925 [Candidatus Marinamargulisbacteria bacterium SCGC AG-343-D04]|nr:hypothetical protein DID78_01925 [Candidatus Marinamargulisbacteria bacterium SCGC AG-343-D04]
MKKKISIFITLYATVFIFFTVLVGMLWFAFNTSSIEKNEQLSNEIINQMNQTIIEKTTNYLMPAIIIAESASLLVQKNVLSENNVDQLENFLLGTIKPHSQLQKLYFANLDGKFIMVYRDKNRTLSSKIVDPKRDKIFYRYRNSFDQIVKKSTTKIDYDPRVRPWYIGAKESEQRFWTDVYIFHTGKRPGITASYPTYDQNDRFGGVFGVDIELAKISEFLKAQLKYKNSRILIINDKNQVVSRPNNISFETLDKETVEPLHITQINDDLVKDTFSNYELLKIDRFKFEKEGVRYLASFASFPEFFGKKWKIVIVVSEKELLGMKLPKSPINFSILAVMVLVLIVGVFGLAYYIAKPLKQLKKDIERLYYGNVDTTAVSSSCKEISELIFSYQQIKEKLIRHKK